MEKNVVENQITEIISPMIAGLGYELVKVGFAKQFGEMNLTVTIFKKGDMCHADCERVHRAIEDVVDGLNPNGDRPYNLCVSSMGLDWPLVTDDDFRRRTGEDIEVSLYAAVDGNKKIAGTLMGYDADAIEICSLKTQKNYKIERKNLAKAIPYVIF